MTLKHQPDQADFKAILPEDIEWKPFPAFPAGARLAIMVGHPAEPGPYVVRVAARRRKADAAQAPEDRITRSCQVFSTSGSVRPSTVTR